MLFIEAPQSKKEVEVIAGEFKDITLLINMVEGGKTPQFEFDYLREKGFKIVLYPTTGVRIVMRALQEFASYLKGNGDTKDLGSKMVSFEGRNEILGLSELDQLEKQFSSVESVNQWKEGQ